MTTTVVRQVTLSRRAIIATLVAFAAALAVAVSLPLALQQSHTIVVRVGHQSTSSTQQLPPTGSVTTDSQTRMSDSSRSGSVTTDSQTRMSDSSRTSSVTTDSQTRMSG